MAPDPALSVLVATYRSPRTLERVLAEVLDQLGRGDELIVVDDGSGDETPGVLGRICDDRVRCVGQDNAGVSAARNRAASLATNPLLVVLDDDEIPQPGWLEAHRSSHQAGRRVVMGRAELVVPAGRRSRVIPLPPMESGQRADTLVNDSFSVRRSDFEAVGGFDERFVHGGEDIDLGLRLARAGVELATEADAVIRHEIDRTYREFRRQRLRRGGASLLLERLHGVALVPGPNDIPRGQRPWAALARWSRPATELVCVALWLVVRTAGLVGSWRAQAAAAGRITLMLGLIGRSAAIDGDVAATRAAGPARVGLPDRDTRLVDRATRATFSFWQERDLHVTPVRDGEPLPDSRQIGDELWASPYELPGVDLRESEQLAAAADLRRFLPEFETFRRTSDRRGAFHLDNGTFGPVDAEVYYATLRALEPARVVEIGSGYSTLLALEATRRNVAEGRRSTRLTAIEPYPSQVLVGLDGIDLLQAPVQDVSLDVFEELESGDVLFLDSTHVLRIGSDVQYEYCEILPRLAPGVHVHVHDIFLPYEYPRHWVERSRLFWNEQYLLQALLAFSDQYQVQWASHYMHRRHPDVLRAAIPSYRPHIDAPGSFWMVRSA